MRSDPYRCEALDGILSVLRPYKPKKFILGEYYMWAARYGLAIQNEMSDNGEMTARMTLEATYRGIPIERSERKYELDFEL